MTVLFALAACSDDGVGSGNEGESGSESETTDSMGSGESASASDSDESASDSNSGNSDSDVTTDSGDGDGDTDSDTDPATDTDTESATGDGDGDSGDGDGDSGTGDGDGDSGTGDGDGDSGTGDGDGDSGTGDGDGDSGDGDGDTGTGGDEVDPLWSTPNLWYSVEDQLHYIEISPADGSVLNFVTSTITTPLINGQNGLTMLEDGSLVGSRESPMGTEIFHIPEPPVEPSEIEVDILGIVPDNLRIEALYTDCNGLVYLMDTGVDVSSAEGNRLLRFTGDYLAGDLAYEVITDLEMAEVADIDDMGPGIDENGEITDGQGYAIDSGSVYDFDYNTGTGTLLGQGGTWGIHALGAPLFDDETARLYLFNSNAELFEADPVDLSLSGVLVSGPATPDSPDGWSSLAGPLTECETTLPDPQ